MASKDERRQDSEYQSWLQETDSRDTDTNYKWFHTEEEDSANFIKDHKSWWNKF